MNYRFFISDMDGVLIDTEKLVLELNIKAARKLGFEFPASDFDKTIGLNTEATAKILDPLIPIPYETLYTERENMLIEYLNTQAPPIKKNVIEGLKLIKAAGLKSSIATSTSKQRAALRLIKTDITEYFDTAAYGDEIDNGKPAPDIFLLAAKRLGARPSECVVFEDSPAGILAAKNAGMHAVLIPDMKEPDSGTKKLCDYMAKDFLEAAQYILT